MLKGTLTREQAAALAGEAAVAAVESKNCEPTNRVGYNGASQGDDLTEWSASVSVDNGAVLTAYYYTTAAQDAAMAETGDGSLIDWEISGYEVAA